MILGGLRRNWLGKMEKLDLITSCCIMYEILKEYIKK